MSSRRSSLAALAAAVVFAACGSDDAALPFFEEECPPVEPTDSDPPDSVPVLSGAMVTSVSRVNDIDLVVQVIDDTSISAVKDQMDALRPPDARVLHDEEEPYDTELTWQADGELWITAAQVVCRGRVEVRLSTQAVPD